MLSRKIIASATKYRRWYVVISIATLLHLGAVSIYAFSLNYGALQSGEYGLELGIGLLGDAGEDEVTIEEEIVESHEPVEQELLEDLPPPSLEFIEMPPPMEELSADPEYALQPEPLEMVAFDLPQVSRPSSHGFSARFSIARGTGRGETSLHGGVEGARRDYVSLVAARLNQYKSYPVSSRQLKEEGVITLALAIDRDGSVREFRVSSGSGFESLDEAALVMLQKAAPFPKFPPEMDEAFISVAIPVSFTLSDTE